MAKKQVIRLTEGDLHRVIKESITEILKEDHGGTHIQNVLEAVENAIYDSVDGEIAQKAYVKLYDAENSMDWEYQAGMMSRYLARFAEKTFREACALQMQIIHANKPQKEIDTPPRGTFW